MPKLNLIETIQTKLSTLTKKDGQLIVIRDNASLYIDLDGARIYISDWIDVATDEERLAMLTPLNNKYYYVVETNKIWRYISGSWVLVTSKNYEDLQNKPQIEGVELSGNKTLSDFGGFTKSDVVDNLESTETNVPLSANQGRVLGENMQVKHLTGVDILEVVEKGVYYVDEPINAPFGAAGYLFVDPHPSNPYYRSIRWMPYSFSRFFINVYAAKVWKGWEELTPKSSLPVLKSKAISGTTSQFGNTENLLGANQVYDKCQLTKPSQNHYLLPCYFNGQKVFSLYTAAQTSRQALASTEFEGTIWYWEFTTT